MALFSLIVGLAGCSGGGGDDGAPPTVIITPPQAVAKGQSRQLFATVVDAAPGVTWTVEGGSAFGTITSTGFYTAPSTLSQSPVVVRATSTDDPRGTATATIRVVVGGQLDPGPNASVPNGGGVASTFSSGQRSVAVSGPLIYFVWSENSSQVYVNISRDRGVHIDPVPVPINHVAGSHQFPVVAVDGIGRAVVAWIGKESGTIWNVYARTVSVSATGSIVLGPVRDIATMGEVADPRVALDVDRAGNAYFAWTAQQGSSKVLVARVGLATSGAGTLSSVVPASVISADHQIRPAIAVNDNGGVLIAWCDPRNDVTNGTNDVWWRRARFTNGAIEFDFPESRANGVEQDHQAHPSVALADSGPLAGIAWSDARTGQRRHVYFVQSEAADLGVPSELREVMVADSDGANADQNFPSLAFDLDGGMTVAFADNRQCIGGGDPQLCAINDDGSATGQTDIYVARSLGVGQSFQQNLKMNDDNPGNQHGGPSVSVDEVGRAFLLWTDDRLGPSVPYMARAE